MTRKEFRNRYKAHTNPQPTTNFVNKDGSTIKCEYLNFDEAEMRKCLEGHYKHNDFNRATYDILLGLIERPNGVYHQICPFTGMTISFSNRTVSNKLYFNFTIAL